MAHREPLLVLHAHMQPRSRRWSPGGAKVASGEGLSMGVDLHSCRARRAPPRAAMGDRKWLSVGDDHRLRGSEMGAHSYIGMGKGDGLRFAPIDVRWRGVGWSFEGFEVAPRERMPLELRDV